MNDLQCFVFASIISADNDEFNLSEDDKQEIIRRRNKSDDWSYILELIKDEKQREVLIQLFKNT